MQTASGAARRANMQLCPALSFNYYHCAVYSLQATCVNLLSINSECQMTCQCEPGDYSQELLLVAFISYYLE